MEITTRHDQVGDMHSFFLKSETYCLKKCPFIELNVHLIPIYKICADTESNLWHQLFGYPCDGYLYSAHKLIDSVVSKFKKNSNVQIFLDFEPHTTWNIKWYNCDTSKIGSTNHVYFNRGIYDYPFDAIPPNQRNL